MKYNAIKFMANWTRFYSTNYFIFYTNTLKFTSKRNKKMDPLGFEPGKFLTTKQRKQIRSVHFPLSDPYKK